MARRNGGVIGKSNVPALSAASGVWGMNDVHDARLAGIWPLKPASFSYCAQAVDTSNASTYTFTSQSIGTAAVGRYVVVGVALGFTGSPTISGVTIAGVAATAIGTAAVTGNTLVQLWGAQVDTGTSGSIVVTTSGGSPLDCGIGVWSIYDLLSQTPTDTGTSTASPSTDTLTTVEGGVALAITLNAGTLATYTWTGLTENFDATVEAGNAISYSGASVAVVGVSSIAVTATRTAGTLSVMVTAAFR